VTTGSLARRALVLGGTGTVGREVLRGLAEAGVPAAFTFHRSREGAEALAREHGHRALAVDLGDLDATRALLREIDPATDVLIHCAAVSRPAAMRDVTDDDWRITQAVNCQAAFVAAQALAPAMAAAGRGDVVLLGALDRTHSVPTPVHFAASQGMLSAMTMAMAKELGPSGIRVNMIAVGVLDGGLSRDLDPRLAADFRSFSALRRTGTAVEVARVVVWLALRNSYMSGKVLPVNGGI
jgi:3-oxoacyl-[acyl-carrier protein] reductase